MAQAPARGELRRALSPLMDQLVHSLARLVLHVTGAAPLEPELVRHHTKVLTTFIEAIDALPSTR